PPKKEDAMKKDGTIPKEGGGKPGQKKDDGKSRPTGQTVNGKVTLDGKPLDGARITFVPPGGDADKAPSAQTNADGTYEIKAGVPKGECVILVTGPGGKVPTRYGSAKTTPLRATVAEGDNRLDVDLTSK